MMLSITIALIVFLISFWRREYGLGAIIVFLPVYLIRATIIGIPTTALELSIYAMVIAWALRGVIENKLHWPKLPHWMTMLTILWVVAWILATVFSSDHQTGLGAFKAWLIDPLLFGAMLLSVVKNATQKTMLYSAISFSGTVVAVWGIFEYIVRHASLQDGRLSSFFIPVANYAAMFLAPILVVTIGAILWQLIDRRWWFSVAVMFAALMLTVSFGGYLSLAIGLLILWWRWPNRKQRGLAMLFAGVILLAGTFALSKTNYLAEKLNATDRSSSLVRSQIWRTSIEMIKDRPWFGVGPNAYEKIYRETVPHLYFPPLEWLVSQPHQLYFALWLETGLLGLLTFLVAMVLWFRYLWPKIRRNDGIAIVAAAGMVAILAHGFVDTPLFKNDLMILFMIIILLPFLVKEKTNPPNPSSF